MGASVRPLPNRAERTAQRVLELVRAALRDQLTGSIELHFRKGELMQVRRTAVEQLSQNEG